MTRSAFTKPSAKKISGAFDLKARSYESNAAIQKELLSLLVHRIPEEHNDNMWLDLGCGTGLLEQNLNEHRYPSRIIGTDFAISSLRQLRDKHIKGVSVLMADIEALPFRPGSFDLIMMSSVLQWLDNTSAVFNSVSSLLAPEGKFLFSIFVKGSFCELAQLRLVRGLTIPVNLPESSSLPVLFKRNGLDIIESENYSAISYFPTALALLRSISSIGGTAVSGPRLTRSELIDICKDYERIFSTDKGIPLSYKACIGTVGKKGI